MATYEDEEAGAKLEQQVKFVFGVQSGRQAHVALISIESVNKNVIEVLLSLSSLLL